MKRKDTKVLKILLVGALNMGSNPNGGEEYKNRLLQKYLKDISYLQIVDTYLWKKKPHILIKLFLNILLYKWDKILISASSKSVYKLVSLVQYIPSVSKKVIYFVIGGSFPSALKSGTFKRMPYEKILAIVVEGNQMKQQMIDLDFKNQIYVVPNFKIFDQLIINKSYSNEIIQFVFISRIHPDKGIGEIVEAVRFLNQSGIHNFNVSFWGPIDKEYKSKFESLLHNNLIYCGVLDIINNSSNAYQKLSKYDVMLFPSYWVGEGFPGVLIDAFISGLPVIASDWNMNVELIKDGENGLIIPPKNALALANAMERCINDRELLKKMSLASSSLAKLYHIDNVALKIKDIIEL